MYLKSFLRATDKLIFPNCKNMHELCRENLINPNKVRSIQASLFKLQVYLRGEKLKIQRIKVSKQN